MLMYYSL